MRARTLSKTLAAPLAALLTLSACGGGDEPPDAPAVEEPGAADDDAADPDDGADQDDTEDPDGAQDPDDAEDPGDADDPDADTGGLSQEAYDQGFTATTMPSGWPDDLPLPDGVPVSAYRSGEDFALVFDLASVSAGEDVFAWYDAAGWSLEEDFEMDGIVMRSYGSPEVNDYGPVRRVTLALGMIDWPTGFQYSLTVQADE